MEEEGERRKKEGRKRMTMIEEEGRKGREGEERKETKAIKKKT